MNQKKLDLLRTVFCAQVGQPKDFDETKTLSEFGINMSGVLELTDAIGDRLGLKIDYFEITESNTFGDICHYLGITFLSCMDEETRAFVEEKQLC